VLTVLLLAAPLLLAQAAPPPRGAVSIPDPPRGRTRTEIIIISPAPTLPGGTIIITQPGRAGVTVCSVVVGVGIMCTGPGK